MYALLREPAPAPESHPWFIRGDHFAHATVAQYFKIRRTADQPLTISAEAVGPKAEYLEYHRGEVFERS